MLGAREEGDARQCVVDGTSLAPDLSGDVLDELQRAVREMSSGLADAHQGANDDLIERLLQRAR